ncbi:MAG: GNVR domain-containing protein, partial [Gemmatimonadales bacterium]
EQVRADLREAEDRLQEFLQRNREFRNSPQLAFEYDRLQREVTMRQQVYTTLAQGYEQARIDEVRNTPLISIVEQPDLPVKPKSRRLILKTLLGLTLGGLLGLFLALWLDLVARDRVRSPEQFDRFSALRAETGRDLGSWGERLRRGFRSGRPADP